MYFFFYQWFCFLNPGWKIVRDGWCGPRTETCRYRSVPKGSQPRNLGSHCVWSKLESGRKLRTRQHNQKATRLGQFKCLLKEPPQRSGISNEDTFNTCILLRFSGCICRSLRPHTILWHLHFPHTGKRNLSHSNSPFYQLTVCVHTNDLFTFFSLHINSVNI